MIKWTYRNFCLFLGSFIHIYTANCRTWLFVKYNLLKLNFSRVVICFIWASQSIPTLLSVSLSSGGIKKATSGSIFYGNACIGLILFIRLARKWPQLVRDWKMVELSMARFGTPRLGWRFSLMSTVLFALAFLEHGLHNWLNTRPGGKDDIAAMSLKLNQAAGPGINFTIDNSVSWDLYLVWETSKIIIYINWKLKTSFELPVSP